MSQSWQNVAQEKQTELLNSIPAEWRLPSDLTLPITTTADKNVTDIPSTCGLLSKADLDITENYTAVGLLDKIRTRQFSSVEATKAFCNCTPAPLLFNSALQRAQECDDYLARAGKPMGPLHGLPISIKESMYVPGAQKTSGYIAFASEPPSAEAPGITATLLSLGAVFYVKTNMSQMAFAFDTDNNLFGRTLNPLRTGLTPGGSSGGESAVITLRGSVLGVGTDSLGSLRVPAHCTGLYTIKPSPHRVPYKGRAMGTTGPPGNPVHVGPLARSAEDIHLFMQAVVESEPWNKDASLTSAPWRAEATVKDRLRIGRIVEDPGHPLHPPMLRTIETSSQKLEKAGHSVISLEIGKDFPSLMETAELALRFALMDPTSNAFPTVMGAGEPLVLSVVNCLPPAERRGKLAPTLESLVQAHADRAKLAEEVRKVFVDNELDAIMMPLHETVAPPIDTWNTATYIAIWNLLPYPAVVMPFGKASKSQDAEFARSSVSLRTPYDADRAEGMPCSVQIVGRPLRDEELLLISEKLASQL